MNGNVVRRLTKSERGSVLMWALIMSICSVLLGSAYLLMADYLNQMVLDDICKKQSFYAAFSGLKNGQNSPDIENQSLQNNYYGGVGYGYDKILNERGNQGLASWSNYLIWGYGSASAPDGRYSWRDSIQYGYGTTTFADYLWLTVSERDTFTNDTVLFWTPDTLDGKVHSNNYIYIHSTYNRPLFLKRVSSCKNDTRPPRATLPPQVFKVPFLPNAGAIYFPDQADSVRKYAGSSYTIGWRDSARFKMYYMRIYGDSYKLLRKNRSNPPNWDTLNWSDLPLIPFGNDAYFVYGKLYIDAPKAPSRQLFGLKGRVTIAASDTIIICHDLVYSCSDANGIVPLSGYDALGLISETWIFMSKNFSTSLYPLPTSTLRVNAGIVALKGSMACEGIYDNTAPEFSSLVIHGSIAQRNRGVVHRGLAGSGRGFVQKDYKYDQRFAKDPPPHFVPSGNLREVYYQP
jgi:hypothetical protein